MSVKLPETAKGLTGLSLAIALASIWAFAIVMTLLPDGSLALEFAALMTMVLGLICAVVVAFFAASRHEQESKAARRG